MVLFSVISESIKKERKTKFSNCGCAKPQILVLTLWALYVTGDKKKNKNIQCCSSYFKEKIHRVLRAIGNPQQLGRGAASETMALFKKRAKKSLQEETTTRISKNK